jgi:hypothetical protein
LIATVLPSRDFTVRSWPLMLAIVPRMRVGGAFCAEAVVVASKPAIANAAPIARKPARVMVPAPWLVILLREP